MEGRMEDDGMGGWGRGREKPGSGRRRVRADGGLLIICEEARAFRIDLDWWQYDLYKCIKKKEGEFFCLKYRAQVCVVCILLVWEHFNLFSPWKFLNLSECHFVCSGAFQQVALILFLAIVT